MSVIDRGDFWTIRGRGGEHRMVTVVSVKPDARGRLACRGVEAPRRLSYINPRDQRIVKREKGVPW